VKGGGMQDCHVVVVDISPCHVPIEENEHLPFLRGILSTLQCKNLGKSGKTDQEERKRILLVITAFPEVYR
jgi:hypothetical protein